MMESSSMTSTWRGSEVGVAMFLFFCFKAIAERAVWNMEY